MKNRHSTNKMLKYAFFMFISLFSFLPLYTETVTFNADSMSGKASDAHTITRLLGNAKIKTDDIEIFADNIELSGEEYRIVRASGNISGQSNVNGFSFSCTHMHYDRETKIAIFENDANIVDLDNNVTAKAQYIRYDQNTEVANMQISVTILHEEAICTSSFAIYRKQTSMLELSGSPKIVNDQDTYTAREITLNLDTEEMTLDGKVTGTVSSQNKKKKAATDE
ncbi:MAG TPA: LptA/OstA family protein [Treponemataceae bacterium]|nr:LptA/OstA family protein [Treponemataceae bacterium]